MPLIRLFPLLLFFCAGSTAAATLEQVLGGPRPAGVVIEVLGPEQGLRQGVPRLRETVTHLRQRFPGLDIAVVSHGREQFALLAEATQFADVQNDMRSLIEETAISVHVCGAHAEHAGKAPEEFVGFVDVAAHGPRQIKDYEALGYVRLKIVLRP